MSNRGDVLQLGRVKDDRLVSDRAGLVWNFPARRKGKVGVSVRILGEGFRFTLTDHWINPCDETNPALSPVSVPFTVKELPCLKPVRPLKDWHDLVAEWDCEKGTVRFLIDGKVHTEQKLAWVPEAGLSYDPCGRGCVRREMKLWYNDARRGKCHVGNKGHIP